MIPSDPKLVNTLLRTCVYYFQSQYKTSFIASEDEGPKGMYGEQPTMSNPPTYMMAVPKADEPSYPAPGIYMPAAANTGSQSYSTIPQSYNSAYQSYNSMAPPISLDAQQQQQQHQQRQQRSSSHYSRSYEPQSARYVPSTPPHRSSPNRDCSDNKRRRKSRWEN